MNTVPGLDASSFSAETKFLHVGWTSLEGSRREFGPTQPDLRAGRFLPAQRQEVLCALDRFGHFSQQFLQIFVAVDEINV